MKSNHLKFIIIILLLFMLIDPSFRLPVKTDDNNTVLLIDVSDSMKENTKATDKILNKLGYLKKLYFTDNVYVDKDQVKHKDQTNIVRALEQIGNKYSSIILVSDGNDISDQDIPNISAKVFSIPVGNQKEDFDIILSNIDKPLNIRDSQDTTFEFEVLLKGTDEVNAIFSFQDEKRPVSLKKGLNTIRHRFTASEGTYFINAGIIPVFGEKITKNNTRDISFEVSRKKYSLLILQDFINTDSAFLKRSLINSCDTTIKLKGKDLFPEDISEYDAVIEFDNTSLSSDKTLDFIENGGLYIFFATKHTQVEKIPAVITKKQNLDVVYDVDPVIPQKYLKSKYFNIKKNLIDNMRLWKDFIDLEYLYNISDRRGEIIIKSENDIPVCEIIRKNRGSAVLFYGGPFYKMSLRKNAETDKNLFDHLFQNLIISNINNDSLIRVNGLKDYYRLNEKIEIDFKTDHKPGTIQVYLNQERLNITDSLNINADRPGRNELLFQLVDGKKKISERRFFFNVYKDYSELEKTTINRDYLEKISLATSGKVFDSDEVDLIKKEIDSSKIVYKYTRPVHSFIFSIILLILISFYFILIFLE